MLYNTININKTKFILRKLIIKNNYYIKILIINFIFITHLIIL